MARARSFRIILLTFVVLAVILALTRVFWLGALGGALVRAENPVHADIAVVLAGDFFGHRVLKGAELVKQGFAPNVLVSGPWGYYGRYECDLAIPFAVARGYPEQYFVRAPHRARSTDEEADYVIPVLRKMGVHRYLLVTSNFHTARAGRLFRAHAPDLEVHVVAAPDEYFTPDGWWRNRESRKTFLIEWEKTLATAAGL